MVAIVAFSLAGWGASTAGMVTVQGASVVSVAPSLTLYTPRASARDIPQDIAVTQLGDFVMTPAGDLATVHGAGRLLQDIWMLAVTPQGASVGDPEYGNAIGSMIGGPGITQQQAQARAQGLAALLAALHDNRAAVGAAPGIGERIAAVSVESVTKSGTAVSVSLTIHTHTGDQVSGSVPVSIATGLA